MLEIGKFSCLLKSVEQQETCMVMVLHFGMTDWKVEWDVYIFHSILGMQKTE